MRIVLTQLIIIAYLSMWAHESLGHSCIGHAETEVLTSVQDSQHCSFHEKHEHGHGHHNDSEQDDHKNHCHDAHQHMPEVLPHILKDNHKIFIDFVAFINFDSFSTEIKENNKCFITHDRLWQKTKSTIPQYHCAQSFLI